MKRNYTKILLRVAAGCLLFFAAGHSVGHFTRHDVNDPKAREVLQIMTENKFDMFGQMRSYDENYTGMSLNLIFILFSFSVILWLMSGYTKENKQLVSNLLIPILVCVAGFTITGYLYFFIVPSITCLLASIFILLSIILLKRE